MPLPPRKLPQRFLCHRRQLHLPPRQPPQLQPRRLLRHHLLPLPPLLLRRLNQQLQQQSLPHLKRLKPRLLLRRYLVRLLLLFRLRPPLQQLPLLRRLMRRRLFLQHHLLPLLLRPRRQLMPHPRLPLLNLRVLPKRWDRSRSAQSPAAKKILQPRPVWNTDDC